MDEKYILQIDPRSYPADLAEEDVLKLFNLCDAVWIHNGDPKKPHAELTSGLCSNAFFDCMRVLKFPNLTEILAEALVWKLQKELIATRVDWVMGSAYAAITFSYEVARRLSAVHGFTEKGLENPKQMLWPRLMIPADSNVLDVEELITTLGTADKVQKAVVEGNSEPINYLPIIGAIVHRPRKFPIDYGNRKVVALVEKEVWAVEREVCPLCNAGSPRVLAKTHWAELTGKR